MKFKKGDTISFKENNKYLFGIINGETMKLNEKNIYLIKIIDSKLWERLVVWQSESNLIKVIR